MLACHNGHVAVARMLVGEYSANVEIQNKVRAMARL